MSSQNLRSSAGNIRTSRMMFATKLLALSLAAPLVLSGCGTQEIRAAAIVDGNAISDKDVQTVAGQINALNTSGQKIASKDVLFFLILAPFIRDEARRTGKTVSAADARKAIAKVSDPAPATIELVQMQLEGQKLDQASGASIVKALGKAKITVNPRYGTFDAKTVALVPNVPNWIKAGAAPGAK